MGFEVFFIVNIEIYFFVKFFLVLLLIMLKNINFCYVIYVIYFFEIMKKC